MQTGDNVNQQKQEEEKEKVRRRTQALLEQGFLSPHADPSIRVGEPLPVLDPGGGQHSWFVPLLAGSKLAGFAQLLPSLVPLRVSSFQQPSGACEHCPEAADWTDPARIVARAASLARPDEQLSGPILTYDQSPSRLAWKVVAKSPSGAQRDLFVAGTAVYEATGSRGLG